MGALLSLSHLDPPLQGVITVKGLVDREKSDFYTLTVVADDGGPKADSTVVSGSPDESPTSAAHHPQGTRTPSSPATQRASQAVGEGFGSPGWCCGRLCHAFWGSLARMRLWGVGLGGGSASLTARCWKWEVDELQTADHLHLCLFSPFSLGCTYRK